MRPEDTDSGNWVTSIFITTSSLIFALVLVAGMWMPSIGQNH